MPDTYTIVTATASISLRIAAYVFLRWIPGHHFPPLVFTLAFVYTLCFFKRAVTTSPYNVVADDIDIVARPVAVADVDPSTLQTGEITDGTDVEVLEELDVLETVVLEKKNPCVLKTLLTGLPSPSSILWSLVTFAINMGLVAMVADLTYRAALFFPAHDLSLVRLGYVSESSANLLVREPDYSHLPITLSYRPVDMSHTSSIGRKRFDNIWKSADTIRWLSRDTDFTAAITISPLTPDTRYQYVLSNNHSGYFITAPPIGQISRQSVREKFTFLHTSCLKAHFPYNPLDRPLHIPGLKYLAKWLSQLKPAFILFLGDFIYIDVPRRHGSDISTYRREYRQVYASPDWPSVSNDGENDLPWLHVYDDHEIANDWSANITGVYPAAFDPYNHYHVSVNPPSYGQPPAPSSLSTRRNNDIPYFTFTQGPASFFMLDTRRFRSDSPRPTMLGPTQLSSLLVWLSSPTPPGVHWEIVVSSVPFTKNWRVNAQDTWAGYLSERRVILEAMWTASTASGVGIVVLSGDRHEFAATAFPPPEDNGGKWVVGSTVHEFSASPLSMFYLPVGTYLQDDSEDVCIKYIPKGNSKFGAVEVEKETGSGMSVLHYRLFVDGEEVWSHVLVAGVRVEGVSRSQARMGDVIGKRN